MLALLAAPALSPALHTAVCAPRPPARTAVLRAQSIFANDGDSEIDWDKEVLALTRPKNRYYQELKKLDAPQLIKEFADTAPKEVQMAVKVTISQLLGSLPPQIADGVLRARGRSLASLMFSMQMTGYMFRNAEYRRSLMQSIDGKTQANPALPAVSGQIRVQLPGGLETQVDAKSYMAELRAEVEGLREQLALAKNEDGGDTALISFMQSLSREEGKQLAAEVSPEVFEAMGQLVSSILVDLNLSPEMITEAPLAKVRELLIVQLVSGYKLRELEVREQLKDRFWDQ